MSRYFRSPVCGLWSVLLLASSGLLIPTGLTQQLQRRPSSAPQTIYRSNVRRVVVDVIVTDAHGQAVKGLKQSDFSLSEERDEFPQKPEKKAQRILSFDTHDFSSPDFVPPKIRPLPVNTFVDLPKEPERGPLYVLYYDMANLGMEDHGTSRKPLLDFVDNTPPGTRFALFSHTDGVHLIQGFTSDREVLHAAITSTGPGPHLPKVFLYGGNYGAGNVHDTTLIMQFFADYLHGVPGRKNLIWVSSGFPMTRFADVNVSNIDVDETKRAISALTRSQIAIYPVDARGVIVGDDPATEYLNEDDLAEQTGGHAYYSDNHIGELLDKAVQQGSSYYTLSYSPENQKYDGSMRKIEVKLADRDLAKAGYKLTYRRTYFAVDPDAPPETGKMTDVLATYREAAKQNDTLYGSIQHGAPILHDLVFAAHVHIAGDALFATPAQMAQIEDEPSFFVTRNKKKPVSALSPVKLQRYLIDYQVLDSMLKSASAQAGRPPTLEFAAAAYDVDGRMVNGIVNDGTAEAASSTGAKEANLFRVEQEFYLPLEAAWLRLAVRDTVTDRTGTLEIRLPLKPEPISQALAQ